MDMENNGTVAEEGAANGMVEETGEFDVESAVGSIASDLFGEEIQEVEQGDADERPAEKSQAEEAIADAKPAEAKPAPKTWRPEAAALWETLPPGAREEILKREDDIFRGIEQYKSAASLGEKLQSVLSPYNQLLQQHGVDPFQQIQGLMQSHYTLAFGTQEQKTALLQTLVRDYNLGSNALEVPYSDPQVASLRQEINLLKSEREQAARAQATEAYRKSESEVAAFAASHEHFDDAANDIAALLKSGVVTTLADAYERAVWMNPVTRAKQQESINNAERVKREDEAAKAKKALAASVSTASRKASDTTATGSIDDTLAATLAAIKTRS